MELVKLIKKCQKNNVEAQEALYRLYAPKLLGICIKYCNDKALADDLFQEAFITIFSKIKQFKHKGSFEGWLKRITINTVLTYYRKQKISASMDIESIPEVLEDIDLDSEQYTLEELLKCVQDLPNQYRLVFNMYVLDEYSHKQIAFELGITEGTSKSNLSRARVILQKKLNKKRYLISG